MKLKPLPTFTIRDCQKAGACEDGVKFYGDGFGMDTKINVCDILNAPERVDSENLRVLNCMDAIWATGCFEIEGWDSFWGEHGDSYREYLTPLNEPSLDDLYVVQAVALCLLELGYDVTGEL